MWLKERVLKFQGSFLFYVHLLLHNVYFCYQNFIMIKKNYLPLLLLLTINSLNAQQLTVTQIATGFSYPVDIKNCGDERLFIVEQPGRIKIIDSSGITLATPFLDITSVVSYSVGGERGLLGLAFDPNYATNGYFYVDYTSLPSGRTHISRFSVSSSNPDSALASSEELLLEIYQPYANHNGGHLAFGPDGYLYIGMGDGGSGGDPGNRSQNLDSLLGKMLRIDVSTVPGYAVPSSNPFVGIAGRDEIWAYGVRNPWRFSFDRITGDLWIADVGQSSREEIDFQSVSSQGGENYGWNCFEGNITYPSTGVCPPVTSTVSPVYVYSHSGGNCSITGGYVYRGAEYANLFGKYFFTDYCAATLRSIVLDTSGIIYTNYGTFSGNSYGSFGENKYGELFLASTSTTGQIYKLGDTSCLPVAHISDLDTIHVCGSSTDLSTPQGRNFTYSWTANGSTVPGSNYSTLHVIQSGTYAVAVTNPAFCTNISQDVYVSLDTVPVVSFSGLDTLYCSFDPPVVLSGNPAGGSFSGTGISGNVFDPIVAGIGLFDITYSFTTPEGCTASSAQQTRVDACTAINSVTNPHYVSVMPNPNAGIFSMELVLWDDEKIDLEIVDPAGRILIEKELAGAKGRNRFEVKTGLSKGVYLLRIFSNKGSATKRLMIE